MTGKTFPVALIATAFLLQSASAAIRYVRQGATGNGSGSDWTNAYTTLPSALIRGDTYYLAGGTYGSYTFDDVNSGSTPITVKKATVADHGTEIGWSNTFGAAQAVFTGWNVYTDFYTFDGAVRNNDWDKGALSQYGIKVSGSGPVRLDNGAGTGGDNLTFKYIDFAGGGRDTGAGDDVIYGLAANKNITFTNCALHDSDRTIFLMRGEWQNLLVESSYIARNASSPAIHGEILSDIGSDYVTFRYNVIEDPEGTAVWAVLNGDGSKSPGNTASNWKIYGNVIRSSTGYNREGIAGIVYCANDASNRNWMDNLAYYNNTHINLKTGYYGVFIQAAGVGNSVKNNIFYSSGQTVHNNPGLIDYNWYYNTVNDSSDPGANKIVCSNSCSAYFRDISTLDVTLVSGIPGVSLTSEYGTDFNGVPRGTDGFWDRGAYEFANAGPAPVAPPTALSLVVQ